MTRLTRHWPFRVGQTHLIMGHGVVPHVANPQSAIRNPVGRVIFGVVPHEGRDTILVVRSVPSATRWGRMPETMKSEPDRRENCWVSPPGGAGAVRENIKPRHPILSWGFVSSLFLRLQGRFRLLPPSVPSAQPIALAYDVRWRLFFSTTMKPVRNLQRSP